VTSVLLAGGGTAGHIEPALAVADALIGLAITLVILRITWQSWATVRGHDHVH